MTMLDDELIVVGYLTVRPVRVHKPRARITLLQLVVVAASLLATASMGGGFLAGVVLVPMLVVLGARAGRVAAAVDGLLAASSAQSWGGPRPT
ncbi:MAG: hypothetical protein M3387_11270 [Actinomycetota bacterium]|nr:hypothetical protein [Actinomycetota bacterium]